MWILADKIALVVQGSAFLEDSNMTGYTVHTGSTEKFATGWDLIFSSGKSAKSAKPQKRAAAKKPRPAAAVKKAHKPKRRK